jgi:hypothetical protein
MTGAKRARKWEKTRIPRIRFKEPKNADRGLVEEAKSAKQGFTTGLPTADK